MMKYIIAAATFILSSCDSSNNNTKLTENWIEVKPFNVRDSLKRVEGLTELETKKYKSESGSDLIIYNYKHSGNGVYELNRSNYGRLYTLRGDAENLDAVVYQLVPFNGGKIANLLYQGDTLLLLNDKCERPKEPALNEIFLRAPLLADK